MSRIPIFCQFSAANDYKNEHIQNWIQSSHLQVLFILQETLITTINNPTYPQKMKKMWSCVVVPMKNKWPKALNNVIVYNSVGFQWDCAAFSSQNNQLFCFFFQSNWISRGNRQLHFQTYPTHQCTTLIQSVAHVFWLKNFPTRQTSTIWIPACTFCRRGSAGHEMGYSRETQSHYSCVRSKFREEQKKMR